MNLFLSIYAPRGRTIVVEAIKLCCSKREDDLSCLLLYRCINETVPLRGSDGEKLTRDSDRDDRSKIPNDNKSLTYARRTRRRRILTRRRRAFTRIPV